MFKITITQLAWLGSLLTRKFLTSLEPKKKLEPKKNFISFCLSMGTIFLLEKILLLFYHYFSVLCANYIQLYTGIVLRITGNYIGITNFKEVSLCA